MRTLRKQALRLLVVLLPIMLLTVSVADKICPNC